MDTARFKYPPFWVDFNKLWESVNSVDNENENKMRGLLVVSKKQSMQESDEFNNETLGISLKEILPANRPKVRFMSELTKN